MREIVERIFHELQDFKDDAKVADYIPALSKVNPDLYAISVSTLGKENISVGDYSARFSIQSISKVFALTLVIKTIGDEIWNSVGREPSGTAFNSLIQIELEEGIPRNPFINAGALVVIDRLIDIYNDPYEKILSMVRELSGNSQIDFDSEVAYSEIENSHRNLSLVHLMKGFGNIHNSPDKIIDLYSHCCSLSMSTEELSQSFLFLANCGINPFSEKVVCSHRNAKRINALMLTCGLYNESGDFAYRVGLPGKSGVGGGIVAVMPGKLSVAVWSPKLNLNGNSSLGIETLERFTTYLGTSVF
ncbi:MAG: glutaminase [Bacteroidales bacterium]|jgi:glutaminase|nr:glutaminase [Bacteroidales bacterium]